MSALSWWRLDGPGQRVPQFDRIDDRQVIPGSFGVQTSVGADQEWPHCVARGAPVAAAATPVLITPPSS